MSNIKIVNSKDKLPNDSCIYLELDYNNPIIINNNTRYPILNAWVETNNNISKSSNNLPQLPKLNEYTKSFINLIYYDNQYKIFILTEPIRIIDNKIIIHHHINDVFYELKNNQWYKDVQSVSFKQIIDKDKINIIHSNYNIMNNRNLFFRKNEINSFYNYILK